MRWSSREDLTSHTRVSLTAPRECWQLRVSTHCGEETWPMCSDTSPPRLLTSPSRMPSRQSLLSPRMPVPAGSSPPTLQVVVLLPCLCCLCTLLTTPELG